MITIALYSNIITDYGYLAFLTNVIENDYSNIVDDYTHLRLLSTITEYDYSISDA